MYKESEPDEVYRVSEDLGDLLRNLECQDSVIYENVDLNDYIPSLSGAAPAFKSRGSKRALVDPEALTRASINAARRARRSNSGNVEEKKVKEKDLLVLKRTQLEAQIQEQLKTVADLEKKKANLKRQLSDQRTRSKLGSRSQLEVEEPPADSSELSKNAEYWREQYHEMEKKFKFLMDALSRKGAMLRVSAGKSRKIMPPPGAPTPTFDVSDQDKL